MALTKPIIQPSTIETDYHRIRQVISLVWQDDGGHAELFGEAYATEDARKDGAAPVDDRVRYDCDLTGEEAALIKRILYRAVKRSHMPDAKDHIEPDDTDVSDLLTEITQTANRREQ